MSATKIVLLVDDDPDVVKFLQVKLEGTGRFAVTTATDGLTALAQIQDSRPDLVLCDIDMPGMNGAEMAKAMEGGPDTRAIPVLFISSLVTHAEGTGGVSTGGRPIISKASPLPVLVKKIDEVLAAR